MAIQTEPKPFHPTEHTFTICGEFTTNTVFWVEYANNPSFNPVFGSPSYGVSTTTAPYTHLVYVNPSCAGAGDVVYYRLRYLDNTTSDAYSVRLRRPRNTATGWNFTHVSGGRKTAGLGVSTECQMYAIPTVVSLAPDFITCTGNITNAPTGTTDWRTTRTDLVNINCPIFFSPGETEDESNATEREYRLKYLPCANLRAAGHQTIRSLGEGTASAPDATEGQNDWQIVDATNSYGSYYSYAWGNALFIHINDWLTIGPSGTVNLMNATNLSQREWLEAVLKEHRHKYKWCFMFGHSSVDANDPTNASTSMISGNADSKAFLLGLHDLYKVNAYFHGHYYGWRCQSLTHSSGHSTWYVCSHFGSSLDSSSGTWHGEAAVANILVGSDGNKANSDYCKINIVATGQTDGQSQGEILNTTSTENGVIGFVSSSVSNYQNISKSLSSIQLRYVAVNLGDKNWAYSDTSTPTLNNNVDHIVQEQFFSADYIPIFTNNNVSDNAKDLWKKGDAPFYFNSPTTPWLNNYVAHGSLTTTPAARSYTLPPWASGTVLNHTGSYVNNPCYFIKSFDIAENIVPTEIQIIYNLDDAAFIWINGVLAWYSDGEGTPISSNPSTPFNTTYRPVVDPTWIVGDTIADMEPFSKDCTIANINSSRTREPKIHYEAGAQPIKIDNTDVISSLRKTNNKIAVLLLQGRQTSGDAARSATSGSMDLEVVILGTSRTELYAPQITSPVNYAAFNNGVVNLEWNDSSSASLDADVNTDDISYEIEYTDNYKSSATTWYSIKKRLPYGTTSYAWNVGKMLKSDNVRIRIRSRCRTDNSSSDWSISNPFSVNVFKLTAPPIISPVSFRAYSDFILIILDESLVLNTYNQKVRYILDYSSKKQSVDWTTIATDIPVGQNVIRWNLEGVPSSDDYVLRITAKNVSTSCVDEESSEPDQISKQYVYNINIRQPGVFLIDTRPPQAVLEIESSTSVTNKLEQVINIFAEDATTEVAQVRLRECDAGSSLALGDLEDPYDPLGGCTDLSEIVADFSKFGKAVSLNAKTHWIFEDRSGLKKIEALLTDSGGNSSLQEQVKVFLSVISLDDQIADFAIMVEQRENFQITEANGAATITAEPSIFEVVYIGTTSGNLWVLEPFARHLYKLDTNLEIVRLIEFNDNLFITAYDNENDKGYLLRHDSTSASELKEFTNQESRGSISPVAVAIFQSILYIGFENGELWSYNGVSFAAIDIPTTTAIKTLYGDNQYLYIGFENSSDMLLYNGTTFFTLNLES